MAKERKIPNNRDESILKDELDEEKIPSRTRRKVQLPLEREQGRLRKFRPVNLESEEEPATSESGRGKSGKKKRRKKESDDGGGSMDELAKVLGRAMLGMLASGKKGRPDLDLDDEDLDFFVDDDDDDDEEEGLEDTAERQRSRRVFTPDVALKNKDPEKLPESLDFSVDGSEVDSPPASLIVSEGVTGRQHSWGDEKAGGTEVAIEDNATFVVGLVREIPLVNRLLIKNDQWRSAPFLIAVASVVAILLTSVIGIVIKDRVASKKASDTRRNYSHGSEEVLHNLDALQDALDNYFGAQTWQEMLATVRNPDEVSAKMERYYRERQITPSKEVIVLRKSSAMMGDTPCVTIRVLLKPSFKEQWVVLVRDGIDSYKIDWEDAVRYQDFPWKEIVATQPTKPVKVRARLTRTSYYNFEFEDAERFQSFQIEDPAREFYVYGYTDRSDPMTEKLLKLTENGPRGVFLSIAYPENGSRGSQVRIVDLVAENWVLESENEEVYDYSEN